ncbi:MAG: sigma-70 family RNA polymerase sigma factor [Snowella sp.]|nr:sigma-70 family RNA polymerase sigma factor [Snowella sp.]
MLFSKDKDLHYSSTLSTSKHNVNSKHNVKTKWTEKNTRLSPQVNFNLNKKEIFHNASFVESSKLENNCFPVSKKELKKRQNKSEIQILFWKYWLEHESYLYRCCLNWLNYHQTNSEELLHSGMLKAYQKFLQYYSQIRNIKAWLRQVIYHLYIDQYRKNNYHFSSIEAFKDILISPDCYSPHSIITLQEIKEIFQQVLSQLPPQLSQSFYLRFYEEKSYEDIARSLSISVCNARKRVQLARDKLKQHLASYLGNNFFEN